ncbi:triose-phosphate isomerase [Neoasaia chiangmaiensis]|nr:triose-phosphate isomerase [Neoasaia chiangmaiensis]
MPQQPDDGTVESPPRDRTIRRCLIAGNWKMNGLCAQSRSLAEALADGSEDLPPFIDLTICPPFTQIAAVGDILAGSRIRLGAQDCHVASAGAFTGDISAAMLADLNVRYVIVGHSERRLHHFETDELVNAKARAAIEADLTPIVCIGETSEERDAGIAHERLSAQIATSLPANFRGVVAYEPIWAIGTGRTASIQEIEETTAHIRAAVAAHLETDDKSVPILYGGSVTARDAASILSINSVGGVLVGGASLAADSFLGIALAAQEALS